MVVILFPGRLLGVVPLFVVPFTITSGLRWCSTGIRWAIPPALLIRCLTFCYSDFTFILPNGCSFVVPAVTRTMNLVPMPLLLPTVC